MISKKMKEILLAVIVLNMLICYSYAQKGISETEIKEKAENRMPMPSFEEREAMWNERTNYAIKNNLELPKVLEKYIVDEVVVYDIFEQESEKIIVFKTKKEPSILVYAKIEQMFWNGRILKIEDDCVHIEESHPPGSHKTRPPIKTLCLH